METLICILCIMTTSHQLTTKSAKLLNCFEGQRERERMILPTRDMNYEQRNPSNTIQYIYIYIYPKESSITSTHPNLAGRDPISLAPPVLIHPNSIKLLLPFIYTCIIHF
ncbi:hypothetical protein LguiB_005010 [Lonicera macranthoides]